MNLSVRVWSRASQLPASQGLHRWSAMRPYVLFFSCSLAFTCRSGSRTMSSRVNGWSIPASEGSTWTFIDLGRAAGSHRSQRQACRRRPPERWAARSWVGALLLPGETTGRGSASCAAQENTRSRRGDSWAHLYTLVGSSSVFAPDMYGTPAAEEHESVERKRSGEFCASRPGSHCL